MKFKVGNSENHMTLDQNLYILKDKDHFWVWDWMKKEAKHQSYSALFNGQITTLQSGQFISSIRKIAVNRRISKSKIECIVKCFRDGNLIKSETTSSGTLYTIVYNDPS